MAEGSIEGVWQDYVMPSPFATEFKFSRFGVTKAPPRNVTTLTGRKFKFAAAALSTSATAFHDEGTDEITEASRRRLEESCSPPSPPPPSPPPPADSEVASLDLTTTDSDVKGFIGGFSDETYGYLVPFHNGRYFGSVDVLDLTTTDSDLKGLFGGFSDGTYGYLVPVDTGAYHGKVARFSLSDFSSVEVLDLTTTGVEPPARRALQTAPPLTLDPSLAKRRDLTLSGVLLSRGVNYTLRVLSCYPPPPDLCGSAETIVQLTDEPLEGLIVTASTQSLGPLEKAVPLVALRDSKRALQSEMEQLSSAG